MDLNLHRIKYDLTMKNGSVKNNWYLTDNNYNNNMIHLSFSHMEIIK